MDINKSPTLSKYKQTLMECLSLYYPQLSQRDLSDVLDYSINKRFKDSEAKLNNSYTKKEKNLTLLQVSDFIEAKEPLCTSLGTMFKDHSTINPMFSVIQSFLDNRKMHKKMMFKYPKGSADFAKYNLMQLLDKIDANGKIGALLLSN